MRWRASSCSVRPGPTSHGPFVVENPEGGGAFVTVTPGRVRAPVPFELSRLMVPVGEGNEDLLVFVPEHQHLPPSG